jgi:hypothetical protein
MVYIFLMNLPWYFYLGTKKIKQQYFYCVTIIQYKVGPNISKWEIMAQQISSKPF